MEESLTSSPPVSHPGAEDHSAALVPRKERVSYDDAKAAQVYDLYIEGLSLRKISELAEMPTYGTLMSWLHRNDSFRHRMKAAHETRAFHFFEKALEASESAEDARDVPAARLKFDGAKWAAEISDPVTYGKQVKVSGDQANPIRIIVSTGLPPRDIDQVALDGQGLLVTPMPVISMEDDEEDKDSEHHDEMTKGDLT